MTREKIGSDVVGTVWKVERQVNDELAAGDVVVILESMKMEIPVEAPQDGRLVEVLVEPDTLVEEGTELFVVES